ncbi:MAG: tetratricopeptide repeat protein [Candidatus Polarisedimenticolia bacterium]
MIRSAAIVLGVLGAAAASAHAGWRLEREHRQVSSSAQVLYLPSGRYLKVASLGFPELLADLVYIWSIQFYGNYAAADRFRYLEHVYGNVISELDPRYVDPYLVGSLIMSIEANDQKMALRLLDKGMAANPREWILPFEAGFICYDRLGDHARAAKYFEQAMRIEGSPAVIQRLHAEMYNKMGDRRTSLAYWREVLEQATTDYVKDVSWRHVHDLTIEVQLEDLRAAVQRYRDRHASWPPDLDSLARAGLLQDVPLDPDGKPYAYDRSTGAVTSQSRFSLYRPGR